MSYVQRIRQDPQTNRYTLDLSDGDRIVAPPGLDLPDEGDEVNPEALQQTIEAEAFERLRKKARDYLASYSRTAGEYREHYRRKGYPENVILDVEPELKEEGFLDDERATKDFLKKRLRGSPRPRHVLRGELREKGVDDEIIDRLMSELVTDKALREQIQSYASSKNDDREAIVNRLKRRGFRRRFVEEALDS